MNLNTAVYHLYSTPQSVYQFRQELSTTQLDPLYSYEILADSMLVEIPNLVDVISNIRANSRFELLVDGELLSLNAVLVKRYRKVCLRVYSHSFTLSFDVTLVKPVIRACL